jgi:hypothetical protein
MWFHQTRSCAFCSGCWIWVVGVGILPDRTQHAFPTGMQHKVTAFLCVPHYPPSPGRLGGVFPWCWAFQYPVPGLHVQVAPSAGRNPEPALFSDERPGLPGAKLWLWEDRSWSSVAPTQVLSGNQEFHPEVCPAVQGKIKLAHSWLMLCPQSPACRANPKTLPAVPPRGRDPTRGWGLR